MKTWAAVAAVAISLSAALAVAPVPQKHKTAAQPRPTATSGRTAPPQSANEKRGQIDKSLVPPSQVHGAPGVPSAK